MNPAQRKALGNTMKLLVDNEPLVNYPLHDVRGPLVCCDGGVDRRADAGLG